MGRPRRDEEVGKTHHVYCRGNRGGAVFEDEGDYAAFTEKLFELAALAMVDVVAFCLMPNHFHLCLRTREGGALLSQFMQRLNLWHARQYNWKHGVRGRLNESRYKAKVVDSEHYLLTLVRYIHQNPVRAGLVEQVAQWRYCSHGAYLGGPNPGVATLEVLRLVGGLEGYRALVDSGLSPQEDLDRLRFKRQKMPVRLPPGAPVVPEVLGPQGERIRQAYSLRARGRSLREIGRALGCHRSTAARLLEAAVCREEEAVYLRAA